MGQDRHRQVLKCPVCGTEFKDIAMICPNCGTVFDQMRLSPSLKAFAAELDEYDKIIDSAPKYFKGKSKAVAAEGRKADLIRNFVFENDGKSILEALLFVKSKVALEADQRANRKTLYWIRLWTRKAEQLYEKARILFQDNDSVETAYTYIIETNLRIQKVVRRNIIAGGAVIAVMIAMVVLYKPDKPIKNQDPMETAPIKTASLETAGVGGSSLAETTDHEDEEYSQAQEGSTGSVKRKLLKDGEEEHGAESLQIGNVSFAIPDYWVESGSREEYYQAYAETGGKVAMLSIAYPGDEEEVSLESLYADNENMIAVIESWFYKCTVTRYEKFQSDFGVEGLVYYYTSTFDVEGSKYDGSGICLCFPSEKDNRWFFVVLSVTDNTEGDYNKDFMDILASIRKVEA